MQNAYEGQGKNSTDIDDFESTDPQTITTALLSHLMSIDDSCSFHISESKDMVNQCLQEAHQHGLFDHHGEENASDSADILGIITDNEVLTHKQDWLHEYDQRKQTWKCNVIAEQERTINVSANNVDLEHHSIHNSVISNLGNVPLHDYNFINQILSNETEKTSQSKSITNMQNTLSEFTLNEMQTVIYKKIAEHSFSKNAAQLRMFIGGPGGTGKSWVIDTLHKIFHTQQQSHRLRLAAYTGVAARNILGMTLHSALCLNKQNKRSAKAKADLIAMWRKIDYLIIDEVSMIGCQLMLQIHEALCEAKENSNLFSGINIIFVGDFAQLPPIGDTKLYSHLKNERVRTIRGQKNVFGKLLWLSIDKVIILKDLVRQNIRQDPRFTNLLNRLQVGSYTDEDYEFLSQKQLRNKTTNFCDPIWAQAPIIVSNNDVKDHLNMQSAKSFAAHTKQLLQFYYATDKHNRKTISDSNLCDKLWSYHSRKTEQRIGMLPLCKGMPVMITQNYDVENGIVNGCLGMLK